MRRISVEFKEWLLSYGESLQVILFFSFLVGFLIFERLWPRRQNPVRRERIRTNALLTLTTILTLPLVPISIVTAAFFAEAEQIGLFNNLPFRLPIWILALLTLFLRGSLSWGTHWLNHKLPMLWRIHRVHHMDTQLDVSSTVRFHPLEMPLSALISVPVVIALGLSPWLLLLYELFDVVVTLFSHSNLRLPERIERWLQYVIVTPGLHTVHHSSRSSESDTNFSAVFPIWDILFGTFRSSEHPPVELGLAEFRGAEVDRFGWLLASPLLRARSTGEAAAETLS
jgi:sterol desaturase/sphingolipid hydroxylase (fatty acid hydroxylase superfamily)